jgi:hypothetical protein
VNLQFWNVLWNVLLAKVATKAIPYLSLICFVSALAALATKEIQSLKRHA